MKTTDQNADDEVHLQPLSFWGICKHSLKIISKQPKIFLKITYWLLLQQIIISHNFRLYDLSLFYIWKMVYQMITFNKKTQLHLSLPIHSIHDLLSFIFYLLLCAISSLVITYTAAIVHYDIIPFPDYKKVTKAVSRSRLWMTVMGTYFWILVSVIACGIVLFLLLLATTHATEFLHFSINEQATTTVLFILYTVPLVYIRLIASLALVISVLENGHGSGYGSLLKSVSLSRGKLGTAFMIFVMFSVCFGLTQTMSDILLEGSYILVERFNVSSLWPIAIIGMAGIMVLGWTAMGFLFIYWYVLQMVLYAACKSYHGESVDRDVIYSKYPQSDDDYTPIDEPNSRI